MKKLLSMLLVLTLFATLLAGCGTEDDTNSEAPQVGPEDVSPSAGSDFNVQNEVTSAVDVAFVTYMTGIPYMDNAWQGAYDAATALGLSVGYYGPASNDTAGEIEILDALITKGVKGIVVTCMDSEAVTPTLKKAREAGIAVVTWDLDISDREGRDYFVNLCSNEMMGEFMIDVMYKTYSEVLGDSFEWAMITSSLTSEQMVSRANYMIEYCEKTYPGLIFVGLESGEGDAQKNYNAAVTLMQANPDLKVIMSNASDALGPIAEAIAAEGKIGQVYGAGMTTPNLAKPGFDSGAILGGCMLWSPAKWAEFAVKVLYGLFNGEVYNMDSELNIDGFEDAYMVADDEFWYNEMIEFTADNINDYDF